MTLLGVFLWGVGSTLVFAAGVVAGRRALRSAEKKSLPEGSTDAELLRAIREGELGVEDLREAGFDKVVARGESTQEEMLSKRIGNLFRQSAVALPKSRTESSTAEWRPLPMTRKRVNQALESWVPGEEVWGHMSDLYYDKKGTVWIIQSGLTSSEPRWNGRRQLVRIRILAPDQYDVSIPCGIGESLSEDLREDLGEVASRTTVQPQRLTQYANTTFASGDPLGRFIGIERDSTEWFLLKKGEGRKAYEVPFYPEDTPVG